jgi:hypothetical protein
MTAGQAFKFGPESNVSSRIKHHFVHVAPAPIFARLKRRNYGVLGRMKMSGGVFVLGTVTTTHVAALQAQAQMDPAIAGFKTIFTA